MGIPMAVYPYSGLKHGERGIPMAVYCRGFTGLRGLQADSDGPSMRRLLPLRLRTSGIFEMSIFMALPGKALR